MRVPWAIVRSARQPLRAPLVATAIHDGHEVRPEVARLLALDEQQRLREEDPWTRVWTRIAPIRVVAHRSRFEVDLNRPRDQAVYQRPEDAWQLHVWRRPPPRGLVERSLALYDRFYAQMRTLLDELVRRHGSFVLLDLHSYNHRREGPLGPPAAPAANPDINVGTGSMDRQRWQEPVERFLDRLRAAGDYSVAENVRFQGGYFPRWIHEQYPLTGCALAVEVKKIFMDEWSGRVDPRALRRIGRVLASAADAALEVVAGT